MSYTDALQEACAKLEGLGLLENGKLPPKRDDLVRVAACIVIVAGELCKETPESVTEDVERVVREMIGDPPGPVWGPAPPDATAPKCPTCSALAVTEGPSSRTAAYCPPFFDGDGRRHSHDGNVTTTSFACANGHDFTVKRSGSCWCGWKGPST